jgi:hypothetical protein
VALLRVSAYNMDSQQRQVSGNNELQVSPNLVAEAVFVFV